MGEIMVHLENCNCIKKADIKIQEGTLNIKYGTNGTGKSTISKAVSLKAQGDEEKLQSLRPYMANDSEKTIVNGLNFNKVMVFNEEYVNSYLFEDDSFLENSFKVFLKSDECEELSKNIAKLLEKLQGIFQKNDAIKNLEMFLPKYEEIIKYNNGEIPKKGGVGEFLKGNGAGFDKYSELEPYKVFYNRDMASVSKWAKWRNDGIKQMNGEACPFCAEHLKKEIEKQNEVISKVFKNSALSTANAVLEYLQEAVEKNYIKDEAVTTLNEYINSVGKEDSLISELKSLAIETDYLYSKINKISMFRPMNVTHEQLEHIEKCLDEMVIDKRQISKFYSTELIYSMVDEVEKNINELKIQTGKLKGLFVQHEKKLEVLIAERKDDINYFFQLAGFPYKFELKTNGENKAISYLTPVEDDNIKVPELDKHLSWGEKNAFYSSCNPIQISVYKDKIYIWNDGEMPPNLDSTDKLFMKHSSKPYNPKLANIFFKSGMIEAWGRGFEKIREACALYDGPLPEYEINEAGIMALCKACDKYLGLLRNDGQHPDHYPNQNGQDLNKQIIDFCKEPKSVQEIMDEFYFDSRTSFRRKYLTPMLKNGVLKMTIPEKPSSKNQKYFS